MVSKLMVCSKMLIVYTILLKPTTCSLGSKLVFEGWSCEDQITQIVQAIEDGFQQRLMKHSVFTILDFSKVYDTVWREKLLLHILNTGVPPTFIRWIRSFLNDPRGHV